MATRVLVLLLTLALPGGRTAAGTLVERTEAFVNKRPVLLSDVTLTAALLKLNHAEATERSIDESLMYEEAARLVNETPPEAAVVAAVETLREKAGDRFSEAALRRKALVQLAIAGYIDLRLRPLVRVDDEQVRKAYGDLVSNDSEPPAFGEVADELRESLESRALDERIEEWVAELRHRAEIRRPPPLKPKVAEPGPA